MTLSEFRALLSEFALAHPERELSSVTVVEFAAWAERRLPVPLLPFGAALTPIRAQDSAEREAETDAEFRERVARERPPVDTHGLGNEPDLIFFDEVHELKTSRSVERGRKVPCECGARGVIDYKGEEPCTCYSPTGRIPGG